MPTIVFLGVDKEDQPRVTEKFPDATVLPESLTRDALVDACKEAEIISIFIQSALPREVIDALPQLKLICTRSVGFNHIDLDACKEKGIIVCNVPDYGSHVIAEHVFALLLSKLRHIPEADERVESGEFDYRGLRGITLKGKTLGVVGTGRIGAFVCRIARGFGMRILACDLCRNTDLEDQLGVHYADLPELLERSDIITLHVPASEKTHHMIDANAFSKMKEGVVLVNTARGELIDSDALLDALNTEKVAHALLDVLEHEQNFEENKELIKHPNAVTTPHIAFYAEESMTNMYEDCFQSIDQFLEGVVPEHEVAPVKLVCDMKGVGQKG